MNENEGKIIRNRPKMYRNQLRLVRFAMCKSFQGVVWKFKEEIRVFQAPKSLNYNKIQDFGVKKEQKQ